MQIEVIPKDSIDQISEHLNAREIKCSCENDDCYLTIYSPKLIESFELLRFDVGLPIQVTSGFRCKEWNRVCQGHVRSKHLYGGAIDLTPSHGISLNEFAKMSWRVFSKVLIYKRGNFLHCSNELRSDQ